MLTDIRKENFETLRRAFVHGDVALMECFDRETGRTANVICAATTGGEAYEFVPFAVMADDSDPFERFIPPGGAV